MASILNGVNKYQNYYSFKPRYSVLKKRRNFRKLVFIAGLICLVAVVLQFVYPADKMLPLARVGEVNLGGQSGQEAKQRLALAYANWSRTIKTDQNSYKATAETVGLKLEVDKTVDDRLAYAWWQRLIPGSFVWRLLNPAEIPVVSVEPTKLRAFTEKLQAENNRQPTNATIIFNGEEPSVKPDQDGIDYPVEQASVVLEASFFTASGELKLPAKVLKAAVNTQNASATLAATKRLLEHLPRYSFNGATSDLEKPTLISWLEFTANESNHQLMLSFNATRIQDFLASLEPYVYTIPEGSVGDIDGQKTTRLAGDDNKAIDPVRTVADFRDVLNHIGEQRTVTITQLDLTSNLKAKRDYSKSQPGLRALVRDLAGAKGDYAIALQELGGRGWSASVNGDKKYITASTYKLFVAYAVLKNIESGSWHWSDSTATRQDVNTCFDKMIIYSDNACAEAMGISIGWENIQNQMRGLGLGSTSLGSEFTSTASDELTFMTKLGQGQILQQVSRDKLLDVMKRQVYRKGIPAGTGLVVADKVGFLYGLLHDAAIVYAPQGSYALVILTNNSSWAEIADSAARIQAQLSRS